MIGKSKATMVARNEKWRPVPGMRGIEASDHGHIKRNGRLSDEWMLRGQRRHRIVARAWLGLRPRDKRYVKFRRGRSCRVSNLYVCSSAASHKRRQAHGEAAGGAVLTEAAVRQIRALRDRMIQREIAAQFGVCRGTISDIFRGRSWRHLTRPA
jgi:hypothetical protein